MPRTLIARVARVAARVSAHISRAFHRGSELLTLGPQGYRTLRRDRRMAESREGVTFANAVTTTLTSGRARAWHRIHARPLLVVLLPGQARGVGPWASRVRAATGAEFVVFTPLDAGTGTPVHVMDPHADASLGGILLWVARWRRRWDVVLVDPAQPLPPADSFVRLQHAAYEYEHNGEVGVVTPGYASGDRVIPGYDFDRRAGVFVALDASRSYGQTAIARYVLTARAHGMYLTSSAIDQVNIQDDVLRAGDWDAQAAAFVQQGWRANVRTLCFPDVVWQHDDATSVLTSSEQRAWLSTRRVGERGHGPRIVFVLNATSISGGIRIVFELADGLTARGFDVEIWSLQDAPSWFELETPVVSFRSYEDMLIALRRVPAITVATWWETAEIVWLASVDNGIPVYLIQEFEAWFYPDDAVARAAVVASYRGEFMSLTEASYQRGELADIGVSATLIPNGYDDRVFRPLPGWERSNDVVLALGRSFFQKNFAMTAAAWLSLGDARPPLVLFGSEPDILTDERVQYRVRPTDAEVNELYNTAAVFVQTSRHEGFCLPILEAMAAGCPVIATDSHGNRDFCVDGVNCLIVDQDDDAGLAAAIEHLLANPDERERLRLAGWETARRYRWPLVLEEVAQFYRALSA